MILRLFVIAVALFPLTTRAEVDIQEVTSAGGITAWLVEEPSIPFMAVSIAFQGGTSLETPDKNGAVSLMTGLLEEGAGPYDAQAFAEAREALAAQFRFASNRDAVEISAQILTENREASLELLKQALQTPTFDPEAIERVRRQLLAAIENNSTDPNDIAGRIMSGLAFPNHPYGLPEDGTAETVAALTREDILETYRAVFAKDRVVVGVVGDVTAAELGPMLDDLLGDLPPASAPLPPVTDYALEGDITVQDFPSPQSVVIFAQPGLSHKDDDFLTLLVLNHILGGSSNARLNQEVRVARGLTYGISSFPISRDLSYLYMGQFSSTNAVVAEAIDVVQTIWANMASEGPTEREVEQAITYLTGAYPLRFDGNGRIASILVGMQRQDLPIDYIATRNDKVRAISAEDVQALAQELLDPEALHFVVVGQPQDLALTE